MAKHVIFVLDISGSMSGKKMLQVKKAIKTILSELRPIDYISILQFSDSVSEWQSEAMEASEANIEDAKDHVEALEAEGGTNIYDALIAGLKRIKQPLKKSVVQPMMIFLTDGHATAGVTEKVG
jgi:Mg-chelatase subunit ChlD